MENRQATDLAALRQEYEGNGIDLHDTDSCPIRQFQRWMDQAVSANVYEPNAMTLSTVDESGFPSSRVVLLKALDELGFVFFTNYQSNKAKEVETSARAALTFLWGDLHRQVRIAGDVSRTSSAESDEYFAMRPRGSQIGAWASQQSREVGTRAELEASWAEFEAKFADSDVPRPPHWGGYRVSPVTVEFWQGRRNRMHDRILYRRKTPEKAWAKSRLQP